MFVAALNKVSSLHSIIINHHRRSSTTHHHPHPTKSNQKPKQNRKTEKRRKDTKGHYIIYIVPAAKGERAAKRKRGSENEEKTGMGKKKKKRGGKKKKKKKRDDSKAKEILNADIDLNLFAKDLRNGANAFEKYKETVKHDNSCTITDDGLPPPGHQLIPGNVKEYESILLLSPKRMPPLFKWNGATWSEQTPKQARALMGAEEYKCLSLRWPYNPDLKRHMIHQREIDREFFGNNDYACSVCYKTKSSFMCGLCNDRFCSHECFEHSWAHNHRKRCLPMYDNNRIAQHLDLNEAREHFSQADLNKAWGDRTREQNDDIDKRIKSSPAPHLLLKDPLGKGLGCWCISTMGRAIPLSALNSSSGSTLNSDARTTGIHSSSVVFSSSMSISQLKKAMKERGISLRGCIEKQDMVDRLNAAGPSNDKENECEKENECKEKVKNASEKVKNASEKVKNAQARQLEEDAKKTVNLGARSKTAGHAQTRAHQYCSNPKCLKALTKDVKVKQCSRCKTARYCSRECQRVHWKIGHRQMCAKQGKLKKKAIPTENTLDMLYERWRDSRESQLLAFYMCLFPKISPWDYGCMLVLDRVAKSRLLLRPKAWYYFPLWQTHHQ